MVDRRAELESIWRSLGIVRETGRPRALVLAGPSGVGKSRLVEQTTERAHELGAAWLLKAVHNELPGPADGLSAMVARHLRCVGLTRPKLLERTERLLREQQVTDPYEWHALAELMAAAPDPDRGGPHGREVAPVHFESPAQRYLLIRRLAERLGRDRPVVIWLDDVQWGIDGLAFARYLLAERGVDPCPALLLLTVRDDALVERPGATALLAEVLSLPSAAELRVQRLAGSDHGRLVRELIPLPPRLAEEVAARTAGSPLFAIQLVGDWVHRELLQATPEGFAPVPGATADLPNDLDDVWLDRIARLLSNVRRTGPSPSADDKASVAVGEVRAMAASHPPATDALEMAAALGREVPAAEWLAICRRSGIAAPSRLLETLLESRLAYPTEDSGWRFAHPMLRESLERQAREGGRWQTHNRACAGVIERLYPAGQSGRAARLARLRAQAGQLEAALRQFPVAFRDLADQSRDGEADALVDEWEAALQRLKAGPEDSRWGVCWLARASARRSQGQLDDAESWSEQAAAQAGTHGWPLVLAKAQRELARTALQRTHFAAASELFRQALPLFEARDDKLGMAQCLDGQAEAALCRGHLDESEMLNQRALPLFQEVGDQDGVSACLLRRGAILQHLGDLDEAERHFLGAKSLHEAAGRHRGVAVCVENLAETARLRGDHAAAERRHFEAERIHRAVGSAIETAAPDLAEPPLGSRRDA
jgi:tetratricopeptide (TPR) repeat protein